MAHTPALADRWFTVGYELTECDAFLVLTHAIKHQIAVQPASIIEVTEQQEWTIDILMAAKELIRAENHMRDVRNGRVFVR